MNIYKYYIFIFIYTSLETRNVRAATRWSHSTYNKSNSYTFIATDYFLKLT